MMCHLHVYKAVTHFFCITHWSYTSTVRRNFFACTLRLAKALSRRERLVHSQSLHIAAVHPLTTCDHIHCTWFALMPTNSLISWLGHLMHAVLACWSRPGDTNDQIYTYICLVQLTHSCYMEPCWIAQSVTLSMVHLRCVHTLSDNMRMSCTEVRWTSVPCSIMIVTVLATQVHEEPQSLAFGTRTSLLHVVTQWHTCIPKVLMTIIIMWLSQYVSVTARDYHSIMTQLKPPTRQFALQLQPAV